MLNTQSLFPRVVSKFQTSSFKPIRTIYCVFLIKFLAHPMGTSHCRWDRSKLSLQRFFQCCSGGRKHLFYASSHVTFMNLSRRFYTLSCWYLITFSKIMGHFLWEITVHLSVSRWVYLQRIHYLLLKSYPFTKHSAFRTIKNVKIYVMFSRRRWLL